MPKVDITLGDHVVIVEDDRASLEEVSTKALALFKETAPAGPSPSGGDNTTLGFVSTERADSPIYDSGYTMY